MEMRVCLHCVMEPTSISICKLGYGWNMPERAEEPTATYTHALC